jgi:hypothetical protein
MDSSSFHNDLSKEAILGTFLDERYTEIFERSDYLVERIVDVDQQHLGVDLILKNQSNSFMVDEKAQLDYLNSSLPTFAFELSYLKKGEWRNGWLFDQSKITNIYFLITEIMVHQMKDISKGIKSVKITGVYREKLIHLLHSRGLTEKRISEIEKEVRQSGKGGKHSLKELDPRTEGNIHFSLTNKAEKPINLVLKLDFLITNNVGSILN